MSLLKKQEIIDRKHKLPKSNANKITDSFYYKLDKWNERNKIGYKDCKEIGSNGCLVVIYESLVTNSTLMIRNLIQFLGIEWSDDFLNHQNAASFRKKKLFE